ncbi:hypothetical protein GIB67_040368 [Kingdonia uniflora]|uniref:Uncharacterized protein n=1 Tax=Kingdonia uniflora TaxID=39325 RepID=A0A7J7L995_9MAGN|nr:hypothetical protein GIB67_040368 [Kingdonia uniflora]
MDWSKIELDYLNGDGFVKVASMKLPDTSGSILNVSINHKECRMEYLKNCSCIAYANSYIREGGSGCVMWFLDLVDIKKFQVNGQDLYLWMAALEFGKQLLNKSFEMISNFIYAEGKLVNGQEIVVKKLLKKSGQGIHELQNEVILIAKLQHQNPVRLLGCCIQRHETMIIYEYMPNKSLDSFIFDQARSTLINREKCFNIIIGIAQGHFYLHRDSRLRIIHRDLKASNALLDEAMRPKISDFDMVRTFGGDQTEGNTDRVVGTYGYMTSEYAIDGLFSVKLDVFSFEVLVLGIVSG